MTAAEIIQAVDQAGGSLEVAGERLRYRLPVQMAPELIEELRQHKLEIIRALCQPDCDCRRLPDGLPVHRPSCPSVAGLRSRSRAAWLQEPEPDPVGDAVQELLKPGEYIDERGRIRRVQ